MNKNRGIKIWTMVAIWWTVLLLCIMFYIISQSMAKGTKGILIEPPTFQFISLFLTFSNFVVTTLFSFVILNHNVTMRKISETSFISYNYSVIDFVDDMVLSEESERYVNKLRDTKDFIFYLREHDVSQADILNNIDDYAFLTVKIPFKVSEGKNVSTVRINQFIFGKDNADFIFMPCAEDNRTLMLNQKDEQGQQIVINLIVKKESGFYHQKSVTQFTKIKIDLTINSLLGVATTGWIELYFDNPKKREKDGANVYKINSTRFRINDLPKIINY